MPPWRYCFTACRDQRSAGRDLPSFRLRLRAIRVCAAVGYGLTTGARRERNLWCLILGVITNMLASSAPVWLRAGRR